VRRVVNQWRTDPHHPGAQPTAAAVAAKQEVKSYSAHRTRWLFWKPASDLSVGEARYVATLTRLCPQIATAQTLLRAFCALLRERTSARLDPWLNQCEASGILEGVGFAQGIRRDYAAVSAAATAEWSQGAVEGHVNRLKMLKRQMYGRAGFALLRRRVLHQAANASEVNRPLCT